MPDIIRPTTGSSTVVVTISSVADQSTLNAVSPAVSATVDGSAATITAWAWKVNGATTGITGPTTATPSYTPTTAGAKVITCDVTILGVVYSSLPEVFVVGPTALSISIAAVSDQLDLSAATLDSTATGGVTPYTYAWTVDGATTGLSSSTAADPTFTPTGAGTPTGVVTVTDAAGQTAKAAVTWRVGTTTGWVRIWAAISADLSDHDFNTTATKTIDGVDVTRSYDGTTPTTHAISSGVWTIDTVAGAANTAGVTFAPVQKLDNLAAYEVCFLVGTGATINTNLDGFFLAYVASGGTYVVVEPRKEGGNQVVRRDRSGTAVSLTMPGGLQARVAGVHLSPWRVGFRPLYGQTAWTGNGPTPDDLTIGGGTPSGWHVTADKAPSATTDAFAPNNDVGASPDTIQVKGRGDNGTAYTLAGITYWVRGL